ACCCAIRLPGHTPNLEEPQKASLGCTVVASYTYHLIGVASYPKLGDMRIAKSVNSRRYHYTPRFARRGKLARDLDRHALDGDADVVGLLRQRLAIPHAARGREERAVVDV